MLFIHVSVYSPAQDACLLTMPYQPGLHRAHEEYLCKNRVQPILEPLLLHLQREEFRSEIVKTAQPSQHLNKS